MAFFSKLKLENAQDDLDEKIKSITDMISNIIVSRAPFLNFSQSRSQYLDTSILCFGISDIREESISKANFARVVENSIRVYEPRFRLISIYVNRDSKESGLIKLELKGEVNSGSEYEEISFRSYIDLSDCSFFENKKHS